MRRRILLAALLVATSSCGIARAVHWRRTWYESDSNLFVVRNRRWPSVLPRVGNAFDIEGYVLPSTASMVFFRSRGGIDQAWTDMHTTLANAGWTITEGRGSLTRRSFTACQPDCESRRFFGVMRRGRGGGTETVLRTIDPTEFEAAPPMTGPCVIPDYARPIALDAKMRNTMVFDLDLDRDGHLDRAVPRLVDGNTDKPVWDLLVMRDGCGHVVGTIPALPADDYMSRVGPKGLTNLVVRHRPDGRDNPAVVDVFEYDGKTYVKKPKP